MTSVVIGASAGLGRSVAEHLAAQGSDLILVARDLRDVEAVAQDLTIKHNVSTKSVAIDLSAANQDFDALDQGIQEMAPITALVVTAGEVSDDDCFPLGTLSTERLSRANFSSLCLLIDHLRPAMAAGSVIVGIGSIAAFRGRSRNIIYAASKRALASFFESLDAALSNQGIRVQFYYAGYIDTNLSFGHALPFAATAPGAFARRIVDNLSTSGGTFYFPRFWSFIHFFVRATPRALWRRLGV